MCMYWLSWMCLTFYGYVLVDWAVYRFDVFFVVVDELDLVGVI